jgi:hypothetical protein
MDTGTMSAAMISFVDVMGDGQSQLSAGFTRHAGVGYASVAVFESPAVPTTTGAGALEDMSRHVGCQQRPGRVDESGDSEERPSEPVIVRRAG